MGIKKGQLKKFSVKLLKGIIKVNKIGKIGKRTKPQLMSMIMDCPECKTILAGLSLPVKKVRKASAAQLRARKEFGDRMRNKATKLNIKPSGFVKKIPKVINEAKQIAQQELEDALLEPVKKVAKKIAKEIPVSLKKVEEVVEIAKDVVEELLTKKQFLDSIFGISVFNFQDELTDLLNEIEDEDKLMKLMSKSKAELKIFLTLAFENADTIQEIIKSI